MYFALHPWKIWLQKQSPVGFFSPTPPLGSNRMMMGFARPFASTGTESWCADCSGKARAVDAQPYCWVYAFPWMKAWGMAIISGSRRTITACPLLISFGNAVHFSTKCSLFFGTYNGPFISNRWNVPRQEGGFQIHLIRSPLRASLKEKKSATAAAQFFRLSNITLSPSITLSANYPSVPITHSARVFARALYLYQCNRHLSISRLQGNGNYLCTCVLHTIIAAPLINATLLNPHRLTDRAGKTLLNRHTHKHKQTTLKETRRWTFFFFPWTNRQWRPTYTFTFLGHWYNPGNQTRLEFK